MSVALRARDWTREMERRERAKTGGSIQDVRPVIARRVGTTPGAIEHVSRGRAKGIRAHLYAAIQRAFIAMLADEIKRAEHEICMARACGLDADADEVAALDAGIQAAKAILRDRP